ATVMVSNNVGRYWQLGSALNGENLGEMSRRDLDAGRVNNALRSEVDGILSVIDLTGANPDTRLAAARNLLGEVDSVLAGRIEQRLQAEESAAVRTILANALAIH